MRGADKPRLAVQGRTFLETITREMEAGGAGELIVVLGAHAAEDRPLITAPAASVRR